MDCLCLFLTVEVLPYRLRFSWLSRHLVALIQRCPWEFRSKSAWMLRLYCQHFQFQYQSGCHGRAKLRPRIEIPSRLRTTVVLFRTGVLPGIFRAPKKNANMVKGFSDRPSDTANFYEFGFTSQQSKQIVLKELLSFNHSYRTSTGVLEVSQEKNRNHG